MNAGQGTALFASRDLPVTRALAAAAGALQLGALATALAGGSSALVISLTVIGTAMTVAALAPAVLEALRRRREFVVLGLFLVAMAWWGVSALERVTAMSLYRLTPSLAVPIAHVHVPRVIGRMPLVALTVALDAAALVLVSDAVRVWLGLVPHQRAPWSHMTAVIERPAGIAWRALGGVALAVLGAILGIGLTGPWVAGSEILQVIALMVVAAGAMAIVGVPVAVGALTRVDRDKIGSARELDRQRFAAHLHDSVLQTLALVQRQAHDPVAVARLARRQEYALRAWMAGEAELRSETVAAALRDAVAGVEDDHGIAVEQTAIGDRPLDARGEALVAAAREALRNAARHAAGASVYVFAEMSTRDASVFVRDEGPGFDTDAVAPERRGIRDAIVGRMASVGGSATIESVPGEGTEVALRLGPGRAAR